MAKTSAPKQGMSLTRKVSLTVLVVLTGYLGINHGLQQYALLPQFVKLERQQAEADIARCDEAIRRDLEHLSVLTKDWSAWDPTFKFMQDRNEDFIRENMTGDTQVNARLNVMLFLKLSGEVLYASMRDLDFTTDLPLDSFLSVPWSKDHPILVETLRATFCTTIVNTPRGPLLVCFRPVLPTSDTGDPDGIMAFGRILSPEMVTRFKEQTRVDFTATVLADSSPGAARPERHGATAATSVAINYLSPRELEVSKPILDYAQRPMLQLTARIPRAIYAQGITTTRFMTLSLLVAGVITIVILMMALNRIILGPLNVLAHHVRTISASGDLTKRIPLWRGDEIGALAGSFNEMAENLDSYRHKLLDSSRQAGMAEVASGVLHNVGNVLNSLNVSSGLLFDNVKASKISGLQKVVDLIQSHTTDLGTFITEDDRGRKLPEYLVGLAEVLGQEQAGLLNEIGTIRTSVDHVNRIIQAQQVFTNKGNHVEPATLQDIVQESITVMEAGFKRHGIAYRVDLKPLPTTMVDRVKLVQLLVNLLTNAKDAMGNRDKGDKHVAVSLRGVSEDKAVIEVTDNGVGISSENLNKIFSNGFSTKTGGQGYGLHYSALAAKEMGGALRAHSDGPGTGATFTLELPVTAKPQKVQA